MTLVASWLVLASGSALIAAAAAAGYLEVRPLVATSGAPVEQAAALIAAPIAPPLSVSGQYAFLRACEALPWDLHVLLTPLENRKALLEACLNIADAISAGQPTSGFAWLVGAETAAELGKALDYHDRYVHAAGTAANEQWQAE